jgi:hypothetical protein
MSLTTLKEDLLHEFREERVMINEQVEMLDPLAISLRKPAAQRLVSSTLLVITEILCYLITVGGIIFVAIMHTIYPFSVIAGIYYNTEIKNKLGSTDFNYAVLAIYGICILCILFVFVIGRMAHVIRLKNTILHLAGKDIKIMIGQHLERKAAIDTLEQKHMFEYSGISIPGRPNEDKEDINEIANPGFGE